MGVKIEIIIWIIIQSINLIFQKMNFYIHRANIISFLMK